MTPTPTPTPTGLAAWSPGDWLQLAQLCFVVIGAAWALILYWRSRQTQTIVALQADTRRVRVTDGSGVLLLKLRITNGSRAVFRYKTATATLMDASARGPDGAVLLLPFAEQNPMLSVYGEQVADVARVELGELFDLSVIPKIWLEPSESVETALAFPLSPDQLGLLAVRVRLQGYQGRLGHKAWVWSTFLYVEPDDIAEGDARAAELADDVTMQQEAGNAD